MSESATEFVEPAEPTQEDQPVDDESSEEPDTGEQEQQPSKDWESEVAKWKAMSRRHEATAKANAEAARKFAEYEESQKSEQQKLIERLETAERERDEERRARARLMAAATYNISTDLLERIGGSSEEEITESAKAVAESIEAEVERRLAAAPPAYVPDYDDEPEQPAWSRPVEALTPGSLPAGSEPEDANEAFRRFLGR